MAILQSSQITGKLAVTGSRDQTLVLKDYTTTQRNALSVNAGAMIFNNTTGGVEFYTGNAWASGVGRTGQTGQQGAQGNQGPQGSVGNPGTDSNSQGAQGVQGPKGPTGASGYTGLIGNAGATGNIGAQGDQGATGNANNQAGAIGVQGAVGAAGPKGPTGARGPRDGAKGPQGNQGPQGPANNQAGLQGPRGPKGPTGPAGYQGYMGATGATGYQGATGNRGAKGPTGPPSTNQTMNTTSTVSFQKLAINSNSWPASGRLHIARAVTDAVMFTNGTFHGYNFEGGGNGANIWSSQLIPGTNRHYITNAGNYYHAGNRSSDARIKKDIEEWSGSVLQNIDEFKPKSYLWKTSPDGSNSMRKLGFIAQDYTASSFSDLADSGELSMSEVDDPKNLKMIITDENSNEYSGSLGFNYDGAAALLVKAVSESKAILDDLNTRITALEG